jgi:hypothetical protein
VCGQLVCSPGAALCCGVRGGDEVCSHHAPAHHSQRPKILLVSTQLFRFSVCWVLIFCSDIRGIHNLVKRFSSSMLIQQTWVSDESTHPVGRLEDRATELYCTYTLG